MALPHALAFTLAGIPIGIARHALSTHIASLKRKIATFSDERLAEESGAFVTLARAAADIDAAYALLIKDTSEIDEATAASSITPIDRMRFMRNIAYCAQLCKSAVNNLFGSAGASTIYQSSEYEQLWRDMNAVAAHMGFATDRAGGMYARSLLGLPQSKFVSVGH